MFESLRVQNTIMRRCQLSRRAPLAAYVYQGEQTTCVCVDHRSVEMRVASEPIQLVVCRTKAQRCRF